ncbi:hypothetical protein [Paenibacillus arenilitoris]|uniref:Uncharacterized protein n=1 Tax=Paenibacillus arenilitoris TaxID=2772299 RepID=A0A927CIE7_9BACL|nr:hypothetical protein [Paenibacillus arenilitoris]MBD2868678.1 hypothetical protein [Paenibacillus arenilitoris]
MAHHFAIEPGAYTAFGDEAAQITKCKEWGLLSEKAAKTKPFFYKGNGMNLACGIVGYVDDMAAVIQFDNGQLHCIHPSYLKEMQASSYGAKQAPAESKSEGQESAAEVEAEAAGAAEPVQAEAAAITAAADEESEAEETAPAEEAPKAKEKAKKEKAQKLQLPEEKVRMTATVKEFTTVPNNFSDTEDEVVIYEAAVIEEPALEVGAAWSSHSATLKKLELDIGDTIAFECKIVAKKLTKHPVPYKINNPSKLQKV